MSSRTWYLTSLIALAVAALFIAAGLAASEGRPVAPLDDAYIHFQYARQIARGRGWQYNDGDAPSSGTTSLLYPFILAAGYLTGFSGERIVALALALGVMSLLLSGWLIARITLKLVARLGGREPPWLRWLPLAASLMYVCAGAVQWAYLNGMESGLFSLCLLAALDASLARFDRGQPDTRWAALWIAIAALLRPDGLILATAGGGVLLTTCWLRERRACWRALWPLALAVLAGGIPFVVNWLVTGSPISSGASAKSWWGNVPFHADSILRTVAWHYGEILERFVAGTWAGDHWFLAPGMLPLAAVGWWALARRREHAAVLLTAGGFFLGTAATSSLITATWHAGRYQVPFLGLLVPVAALGVAQLVFWLPGRFRTLGLAVAGLYLLAASAHALVLARASYANAVYVVAHQQIALGDWMRENLPPGTQVAVSDAGALRYVSERPILDLVGLTTQGAAVPWRHASGSLFEFVEQASPRPNYFATYPDVYIGSYFLATDLFGTELAAANVPDHGVPSASNTQVLYRADWQLADSGDQIYQEDIREKTAGLRLAQAIDVADLSSEEEHGVTWWEGPRLPGYPTEVKQLTYRTDPAREVLDGGRMLTGGLAFRARVEPGQPLLLVARLHATQAAALRVWADGQEVGLWRYPAIPGEWLETAFRIPAEAVARESVEIRLVVEPTEGEITAPCGVYYLWVWQGEAAAAEVAPKRPLAATLGDHVELLGYDLDAGAAQPGGTLELALYWRAAGQRADAAKVFVHLYDPAGKVAAQVDRQPYYGTRPPYTWTTGEVIRDPYALKLPADLAPGAYTLVVGMYDELTGARLPVRADAARVLPDSRLRLGEVAVR